MPHTKNITSTMIQYIINTCDMRYNLLKQIKKRLSISGIYGVLENHSDIKVQ